MYLGFDQSAFQIVFAPSYIMRHLNLNGISLPVMHLKSVNYYLNTNSYFNITHLLIYDVNYNNGKIQLSLTHFLRKNKHFSNKLSALRFLLKTYTIRASDVFLSWLSLPFVGWVKRGCLSHAGQRLC